MDMKQDILNSIFDNFDTREILEIISELLKIVKNDIDYMIEGDEVS